MKKLFILICLFIGTANTALATSPIMPNPLTASIVDFQVNHQWIGRVDQGSINVDLDMQTLSLVLMSQPPCGPNMICAAVMEEFHQFDVSIIESYQDSCGATHYIGEKDETIFDGLLETIHVIDYTTMQCDMAMTFPTSVTFKTFNPWTQLTTESYFGATELLFTFPEPTPMPTPVPMPAQ